MACGKSTLGRKLNQRLNWQLYDTDKEIVTSENMTVAEIFDQKGEEHFRELESLMIKSLSDSKLNAIISTGGGAPMWGDNMTVMNNAGLTIYLSRTAQNIAGRLSAFGREKRPKLRGLSDEQLLKVLQDGIAERDSQYRKAKLIIEADKYSDEVIVDMIIDHISHIDK